MKTSKKSTKKAGQENAEAKAKKFYALAEANEGKATYGVYVFEGHVYTGRLNPDTGRAYKSAIPVKVAKKLGLIQ